MISVPIVISGMSLVVVGVQMRADAINASDAPTNWLK